MLLLIYLVYTTLRPPEPNWDSLKAFSFLFRSRKLYKLPPFAPFTHDNTNLDYPTKLN